MFGDSVWISILVDLSFGMEPAGLAFPLVLNAHDVTYEPLQTRGFKNIPNRNHQLTSMYIYISNTDLDIYVNSWWAA